VRNFGITRPGNSFSHSCDGRKREMIYYSLKIMGKLGTMGTKQCTYMYIYRYQNNGKNNSKK
jgi:hypothetical protein